MSRSTAQSDMPSQYGQQPSQQGSLGSAAFFALGTFAIGTEGFMIVPLLPRMAADFDMSVSAVASLIVGFTLTLALSSPVLTVLTGRFNRRDILMGSMAVFIAANLIAAASAGFSSLFVSRLLMAVSAGLYMPNANALAGAVVSAEKRGRALAIVSGGMTLAIALGLPLGSLVGHAFGWRSTFIAVAAMGAIACAGISVGVSRIAGAGFKVASVAERVSVVMQPAVRQLLLVGLFWAIGAYSTFAYFAPYLDRVLGFGEQGISATVTLWGVIAAAAVIAGGTLSDRLGPNRIVRLALQGLVAAFWSMAASTFLAPIEAQMPALIAIAVWGFSAWSFFVAHMARLAAAGTPQQAPVALSLNTSTMYLGFSVGSAIGAAILGTGAIWGIGFFSGGAVLVSLLINRRYALLHNV